MYLRSDLDFTFSALASTSVDHAEASVFRSPSSSSPPTSGATPMMERFPSPQGGVTIENNIPDSHMPIDPFGIQPPPTMPECKFCKGTGKAFAQEACDNRCCKGRPSSYCLKCYGSGRNVYWYSLHLCYQDERTSLINAAPSATAAAAILLLP